MSLSPSQVNARMKLLDRPNVSPAKCAVCGAVDRPVVDFNCNVEWYGAILLCTECIAEAGRVVGLVPSTDLVDNERETKDIVDAYLLKNNLTTVYNGYHADLVIAARNLNRILAIGATLPDEEATDTFPELDPWANEQLGLTKLPDDPRIIEGTKQDNQFALD